MVESKLVKLNFENNSYSVYNNYNIYASSMLSLGCILISDLVVASIFMHLLPGMDDSTLLGHVFFTPKVLLHEIIITEIVPQKVQLCLYSCATKYAYLQL